MMDLVIVGASGFGKEVARLVEEINNTSPTWNILGYVDDADAVQSARPLGYPVLGRTSDLAQFAGKSCVIAVGTPRVRRRIAEAIREHRLTYPCLVHPSVRLHKSVTLGDGVVICQGNCLTVEITFGSHVHLNLASTVGHGAVLDSFCTIYPGVNISGDVILEPGVSMGTGSSIIQGVRVGAGSVIGAGSAVVRDIPPSVVAVGSPAKPSRELEPWSTR